ncbi:MULTISPECIES: hypothetical protein [Protofrankia]|uniref:Uncharacterized protein n=1 Tax=Candidatus Protofrankia datiscae TaxID=2716812 RepID=F8AXR3_9ACTN|nr:MULTISPECIES: hypothetical protein [Protofrankia]AEH11481.1 hypothetical protein FsymDg_4217 [Candidatus Protofrankia datiscae]
MTARTLRRAVVAIATGLFAVFLGTAPASALPTSTDTGIGGGTAITIDDPATGTDPATGGDSAAGAGSNALGAISGVVEGLFSSAFSQAGNAVSEGLPNGTPN